MTKVKKVYPSRVEWICYPCRREKDHFRRRRLGMSPLHSRPANTLKWGKKLLKCRPPECEEGRIVLEAVRNGETTEQIADTLGVSSRLAQYYMKRLVARDAAKRLLEKGAKALEENLFMALTILTTKQLEAVRMLLAGADQGQTARTLGVTQAAVSSRLRYARKLLATRGAAWSKTVLVGLETLGKTRNLSRFQLKPGRRKMHEQKNEIVRETAVTVEMSASELNFAVASWAAAQPEASADLKKLVADGANINVTVKPDGTGGTMRVWRETGPQFKIGE